MQIKRGGIRTAIKAWLFSIGWVVERTTDSTSRDAVLQQLVLSRSPSWIIDVGANRGQFAESMRRLGYSGRILSIEPHPEAFTALSEKAARDDRWYILQAAIGSDTGTATLFALDREASSSLHRPAQIQDDPRGEIVHEYEVELATVDQLVSRFGMERVFLKSDAQGSDLSVMRGARDCLASTCIGAMFEGAVTQTYEGTPRLQETVEQLEQFDFGIAYASPVFVSSGSVLELDVLMLPKSK